jgi:branched-chain amino acid transport system ATP-binding protein
MQPKILPLDEPAVGFNLGEAEELSTLIGRIRDDFGCGALVIEHNMRLVVSLCASLHVLAKRTDDRGGTAAEVQANAAFRAAYPR